VEVLHTRAGIVALYGPEDFERRVLRSKRPALVVFYSPGCASCKSVMRQLPQIASAYGSRMSVYTMKTGTWGRLEEDYDVRFVPALLFFSNGRVCERLTGWKPTFWTKRIVRGVLRKAGA